MSAKLNMTAKKCIFCQGGSMSKEHFWPDWMSSYFEKSSNSRYGRQIYTSEVKSPSILSEQKYQNGHLSTKKFRVVCKKCNNGWMSQLEEKVKPLLLRSMENKLITLSTQCLSILSRWLVMKVIVAEQAENGLQVTPEADRKLFHESQQIPDYFRVYMARHNTADNIGYHRYTCTLALSKDKLSPPLDGLNRNMQTVSFLIGPMFIFITAARVYDFNLESKLNFDQLCCIYPNKSEEVSWNTIKELDKSEMESIVWALDRLTSSPSIKYGGPLLQT